MRKIKEILRLHFESGMSPEFDSFEAHADIQKPCSFGFLVRKPQKCAFV